MVEVSRARSGSTTSWSIWRVTKDRAIIKRREALRMLGKMWATLEEVAGFFNVHRETIRNWFNREPEARVIYEDAKLTGEHLTAAAQCPARGAERGYVDLPEQEPARDERRLRTSAGKSTTSRLCSTVLLQELGDGTHGKVIQHDETER